MQQKQLVTRIEETVFRDAFQSLKKCSNYKDVLVWVKQLKLELNLFLMEGD
jgi:hypothetical protein